MEQEEHQLERRVAPGANYFAVLQTVTEVDGAFAFK
jgi:hypothetical protein